MKFATKLTATVIIASAISVPTLGFSVFYLTRNIVEDTITADQVRQTQGILNDIDRSLYNAYQDIQLISNDPLLVSYLSSGTLPLNSGRQKQYLIHLENEIQLTGPWDLLNVINIDGEITYSSHGEYLGKNIKQFPAANSAHYAAISGQRYYSDLVNSKLTTRPGVIFSAAIKDTRTQTVVGTVIAHFSWPIVLQILDGTHSSRQIQLFNRAGVVIATPSAQKGDILKKSLSQNRLVQQLFRGKPVDSGIETLNDNAGSLLSTAAAQAGYLSYRGHHWGLLLGVPTEIAFAPVFQLARNITFIILAILTLMTAIIYLYARRIAKPLEVLRKAAVAIGSGNYDYPVEIKSGDEIQELGDSFVEMAQNRKQAETEIRTIQAELQRQEHLATMGQLTATVNHELRNPLAAIRTSLYRLNKCVEAGDYMLVGDSLDLMDRNVDRCDHIIDQMLDFTRVQSLDREDLFLDEWLLALVDEQNLPDGIDVEFEMNMPGRMVSINADGFRRAVLNLIDNACKAMVGDDAKSCATKNAKLKISTRATDERIEVEVADTGPGITEDVLPHIFEPLYSTRGFGVGLGLPTVRELLVQHGGDVKVNAVVGEGTSMLLWFPAIKVLEAVE